MSQQIFLEGAVLGNRMCYLIYENVEMFSFRFMALDCREALANGLSRYPEAEPSSSALEFLE